MIRVSVIYPHKDGARFDWAYYTTTHIDLVRRKWGHHGLTRIEIDKPIDHPAGQSIAVVAHLYFDSLEGFQQAMQDHGAEIVGDVPNYTDIQPQVVASETVVTTL